MNAAIDSSPCTPPWHTQGGLHFSKFTVHFHDTRTHARTHAHTESWSWV